MFIVLACVFWLYVIPILTAYEKLELFKFYGWMANSTGQVKQASFIFFNNGTKELTLSKVLVNGTFLKSSEWGLYYSRKLDPHTGERVFVAPETTIFELDKKYNFTIETSSGNHFPFLLKVEEEMVKQENLTIIDYYFSSGILVGYQSWDIRAGNFGDIPIIVRRTTVFNDVDDKYWKFERKQWFFPNEIQALELNFSWGYGVTYYATIETAAGNEYYVIETAE